jgi:DNA-cytosine methyltransferase
MMTYKILDLFSGLGGFSLGLERTGHFETAAFCDNDKFSKLILDKHWKGVKIYDDVREITKEKFKEDGIPFPDIITGGFPCQPFSVAGKQKGTSDDRHLWPEMFRIIKAFKPRYVIGENVRGIINIQDGVVFETVCTDLESEGYEVQPFIIPAAGVGAPHRRERVWIVANREESMVNSNNHGLKQYNETEKTTFWRGTSATSQSTSSTNVADTISNDEGREISRSDEETRGIQEEHRTEHSTTRKSSRTSEVWNGDDGYETTESNVANTEGLRFRGRSGEERGIKKNEFQQAEQKGSSFWSETERRSSQSGGDDVADTESIESNVRGLEQRQRERSRQGEVGGASGSTNVADTNPERLQRAEQSKTHTGETETQFSTTQSSKAAGNFWLVEPNVGRVAHGVSGRVHRLKGLGNSIVPQIAEEIGYALIKAERE